MRLHSARDFCALRSGAPPARQGPAISLPWSATTLSARAAPPLALANTPSTTLRHAASDAAVFPLEAYYVGGSAATPAAVSTSTSKGAYTAVDTKVLVRISVPFRVSFGEVIKVVGSGRALGDWDVIKAPRFEWTEGDIWVGNLLLDAGQEEFKVVVFNECTKETRWESSGNRLLKVPNGPGTLTLSCYWQQPSTSGWFVGGKVDLSNVVLSTSEPSVAAKASSSSGGGSGNDRDIERSGSPEPSVLLSRGWDAMLRRSGSPEPAYEHSSSSSASSSSGKYSSAAKPSSSSSSLRGRGAARLSVSSAATTKASRWRSVVLDEEEEGSGEEGASSDEEDYRRDTKRSSGGGDSDQSSASSAREATLASMRERLMNSLTVLSSSSKDKDTGASALSSSKASSSSLPSSSSGGGGSSSFRQFSVLRTSTPVPSSPSSYSSSKRRDSKREEDKEGIEDEEERWERRQREARRSSHSGSGWAGDLEARARARARDRDGGDWGWERLKADSIVSGVARGSEVLARNLGGLLASGTMTPSGRARAGARSPVGSRGGRGAAEAAMAVLRQVEGIDGSAVFKRVRDAINTLANSEETAALRRQRAGGRSEDGGSGGGLLFSEETQQLLRAISSIMSTKSPSAIRGEAVDVEDLKEAYRSKPPLPSVASRHPPLKRDSSSRGGSSSSAKRWQEDEEHSSSGSGGALLGASSGRSSGMHSSPAALRDSDGRRGGRDWGLDEDSGAGRQRVGPGLEHLAHMLNEYWDSLVEERAREHMRHENPRLKLEVELPVNEARDPAVLGGVAVVTAAVLAVLGTDQYALRQNLATRGEVLRAAIMEPVPARKTPQPSRTIKDASKAAASTSSTKGSCSVSVASAGSKAGPSATSAGGMGKDGKAATAAQADSGAGSKGAKVQPEEMH